MQNMGERGVSFVSIAHSISSFNLEAVEFVNPTCSGREMLCQNRQGVR